MSQKTRDQLEAVLLSCNPTPGSRFENHTGRRSDIPAGRHADARWDIACNRDRVDIGTLGVLARRGDGGSPPLAGVLVCTGPPAWDSYYRLWFAPGILYGFQEKLRIPAGRISSAGWPATHAPWGANNHRQFEGGQRLPRGGLDAILDCMSIRCVRTLAKEVQKLTGSLPTWWDAYQGGNAS